MMPVGGASIKRKLMSVGFVAAGVSLLLACASFATFDVMTYRSFRVENLTTQASIIGYNVASALVFYDRAAAEKTLSALSSRSDVVQAGVYGKDSVAFAAWRRNKDAGNLPPLRPEDRNHPRFGPDSIEVFRPITFDGEDIGTVYIRSNLSQIRRQLKLYAFITGIVLGLSFLVAFWISIRRANAIAGPILRLAAAADAVSKGDYSVRVDGGDSRDEIGMLVNTFNGMLARIQAADEELRRSHDDLEQRVADRTWQLAAANKELEAFSYSVSHDLRAPLRAVDGFARAILEDYGASLPDQGKSDLNRVIRAAGHMAQLIDDMLNLSRVSRSEVVMQKVDLAEIAAPIVAELKRTNPDRSVAFVCPPVLEAHGDPKLLGIVLGNLLSNAWKFTSKKPDARVELGSRRAAGGATEFFVRDNGAGFDMAYAAKLFGVFQRLHRVEDFPGTGVGLATVQRIIHKHGGHITAESSPNNGATFFFTL